MSLESIAAKSRTWFLSSEAKLRKTVNSRLGSDTSSRGKDPRRSCRRDNSVCTLRSDILNLEVVWRLRLSGLLEVRKWSESYDLAWCRSLAMSLNHTYARLDRKGRDNVPLLWLDEMSERVFVVALYWECRNCRSVVSKLMKGAGERCLWTGKARFMKASEKALVKLLCVWDSLGEFFGAFQVSEYQRWICMYAFIWSLLLCSEDLKRNSDLSSDLI